MSQERAAFAGFVRPSEFLSRLRSALPPHGFTLASIAAIYYLLLEWSFNDLAEFDAYYHVALTEVYRAEGFVRAFPWMSASILRDHFHDPQLLIHLLIWPWLALGVEPIVAGKLVAVLTATVLACTIHWFLTKQQVRFAMLWTLVYLVSSPYLMARLTFIKSTAIFFSIVLFYADSLFTGRRVRLLLSTWLAVVTYQGFPLLLVFALLWLGIRRMLREPGPDTEVFPPILAGMLAGLVVCPFFPNNLRFLHFELIQQILLKPKELTLGAEWAPVDTMKFLGSTYLPILFLFFSEILAAMARAGSNARIVLFRSLAVFLLIGAMTSARLIDYFVPMALIASAMTVSCALEAWGGARLGFRIALGVAMFLCVPAAAANAKEALRITSSVRHDIATDDYRTVGAWLKEHTGEGEVVVSQWDDFPMLFHFDRKNRYLWGLNAAYGYGFDPRIYAVISMLYDGRVRDPESFLPQVNARYVVVARTGSYPPRRVLVDMLRANPHFDEVLRTGTLHLFHLRASPKAELSPSTAAAPDSLPSVPATPGQPGASTSSF